MAGGIARGDEIARVLAPAIKGPPEGALPLGGVADTPLLPGGDGLPRRDLSREHGPHTTAHER